MRSARHDSLREGLSPLDEERADSMASEGGRSAQALDLAAADASVLPLGGGRSGWWWAALAASVLGALAAYRGVRRLR